jgi:UDP-N-acetylmuramate--alanine ligase
MASFVLEKAGLDPAFVVGGIVPEINTNAQHKEGKFFTAELDESDGTLVKYHPDILVINNLEEDHLDYYKNGMSDLVKTFNQAVSQSKKVIVNADDEGIKLLTGDFITFGLNEADYVAKNIKICYINIIRIVKNFP